MPGPGLEPALAVSKQALRDRPSNTTLQLTSGAVTGVARSAGRLVPGRVLCDRVVALRRAAIRPRSQLSVRALGSQEVASEESLKPLRTRILTEREMVTREQFDIIKTKHGQYASWAVWASAGASPTSNVGDISVLDPETNPSSSSS